MEPVSQSPKDLSWSVKPVRPVWETASDILAAPGRVVAGGCGLYPYIGPLVTFGLALFAAGWLFNVFPTPFGRSPLWGYGLAAIGGVALTYGGHALKGRTWEPDNADSVLGKVHERTGRKAWYAAVAVLGAGVVAGVIWMQKATLYALPPLTGFAIGAIAGDVFPNQVGLATKSLGRGSKSVASSPSRFRK